MATPVDFLKKVRLQVTPQGSNAPVRLCFVYGTGVSGLAPLEAEVAGKMPGETATVTLPKADLPAFFGHLGSPVFPDDDKGDTLHLSIRVEEVSSASDRDVVKAMADATACGHCDGDEGCCCGC